MTLSFRNVEVNPSQPVEEWGFEGLLAAVDRGGVRDWVKIADAVRRCPWGPIARILEDEVLPVAEDSGVVGAMRGMIDLQRARAKQAERDEVRSELQSLLAASA